MEDRSLPEAPPTPGRQRGKRLRPILILAAAEAVGGRSADALPLACSLELIHTYSLIHDDLPAMDDDDFRRGKPTCHKVFGEAIAILAGDALLTEAFRLLTRPDLMKGIPPGRRLRAIHVVALAAGSLGMVGGQTVDILSEGRKVSGEVLEYIHRHKTGALITASVCAGGIAGGASSSQLKALAGYGEILDVQGSAKKIGKAVGKDASKGKATYPGRFGVEISRDVAESLIAQAIEYLAPLNRRAAPLREIARFVLERTR
ncbi:MAG: polyprenyl synthetase family protein [Deltaproteobacteria bacterium]|nr:polyprenyl synthetase family protein [Deltaproteobacteria bacterium]